METPSAKNLAAARELGETIDGYLATSQPLKVQQLGGEPLSGQRTGDRPGSSEIYLVTFHDGDQAFFKPLDGVDEETADYFEATAESVAVAEVAAVAIARHLGAPYGDLVTSTVLREVNGALGTICWRLEGAMTAPNAIPADQRHPAALLDSLIGNQDRHMGNYLYDADAQRLGLFDHGFTFAVPGSYVNASYLLDSRLNEGARALTAAERDAIERLDLSVVDGALTRDRLAALEGRVAHMLDTGTLYDLDAAQGDDSDDSEGSSF